MVWDQLEQMEETQDTTPHPPMEVQGVVDELPFIAKVRGRGPDRSKRTGVTDHMLLQMVRDRQGPSTKTAPRWRQTSSLWTTATGNHSIPHFYYRPRTTTRDISSMSCASAGAHGLASFKALWSHQATRRSSMYARLSRKQRRACCAT